MKVRLISSDVIATLVRFRPRSSARSVGTASEPQAGLMPCRLTHSGPRPNPTHKMIVRLFAVGGRRLAIALLALLFPLLASASARAADPLGFQIEVPPGGLFVHEDDGQAVITVTRSPAKSGLTAQVRYITSGNGYDPHTNGPFQCNGMPCTQTSYA